jgi:hypothetical protein
MSPEKSTEVMLAMFQRCVAVTSWRRMLVTSTLNSKKKAAETIVVYFL